MEVNYHQHMLSNGLRIVHKPSNTNVAYCGFLVNVGTRDEKFNEFGMAHFVEHMLFKGTEKRKSYHIINRMEAVGGELNAFTNKEETVIYATFLEQHYDRAIELLSDLAFNSQFPQNEIEKEVEVIIDEIHSYEDSPSELIFDDFEDQVFKGMEIGHNILGTEEHLLSFNTEMTKDFVSRYYVPSNMVFFSFGKTKFEKIVRLANKYLSNIPTANFTSKRAQSTLIEPTKIRVAKNTSQAHAVIGSRSYPLNDEKRKTLSLLNNILGGPGMNSRLNVSLREKRGYVYNVESGVSSYSDAGVFSIYFGCDKKNVDRCISLVHKELEKLRDTRLTDNQLFAAKKQYIGQIGVSSDHFENVALALGKNYFHFNHFNSLDEVVERINSVNSEQICEVANEILAENRLFSLIYH